MVDKTRRVVVGPVEELPPGERKIIVPFRGRAGIGVFNVNGTFHALRNLCPGSTWFVTVRSSAAPGTCGNSRSPPAAVWSIRAPG
jgi:hypothetical protein